MPATQPQNLLHFEIIETLGSGGNGTVYRAHDPHNQTIVAIKTLKNATELTLNRFKREFLSLKKMDNPGIVAVYDGFFDHDPPFFSMEWVRGKTLSQVLRDMENNPLIFTVKDRENFALRLGVQVCDILTYIHSFDEVHRDLKPDNIFITQEGNNILSDFVVKMLDFGLLKQVDEETQKRVKTKEQEEEDTQSGMIVGTVHYLSPEQAKGSAVDIRSDLYSLGVILYRTIGLRLPYRAKDVVGYIFKTVFEDPDPIESHTVETSKTMQALLQELLAKEPGKRPPSAAVLKRRLKAMLEPKRNKALELQASDLEFDTGIEGFGSPLLPPPLIGREDAIKNLEMQTDKVDGGHPQAVILVGEPGMGRTSIIKEWKSRILFKKPIFLQAHFSEEPVPSQEPIGMLLDSLIRTMKPEDVKRVFRDVYPFLAESSRYLSRYFDTKSVGKFDHLSPGRKLQVLAVNIIKLVQALEADGPVIMILDDVQNAPERFYGWLTLFWEQLGSRRLLLVFSCAPDSRAAHATQFRRRLKEAPETLDLELKPLDNKQTKELIQAMLPIGVELPFSQKLEKLLMERAQGNPFYATELFSRLYEDEHLHIKTGTLDLKTNSVVDVPLSIHQALLKKVERLPKDAHHLVKTASVFGPVVDYQVLETCLQWPDEKFLNNLAQVIRLGVLSEEADPAHRLHFNAPALQKVLYEKIPAQVRIVFHGNAALAIETHLDNDNVLALEQVAFHYANAANYVRAVKYAYLAGNCALEAKETDKAVYFYQLALSMMDKMENRQARNLVNLKLAEVYLENNQPQDSLDYYNKSLQADNLSKMESLRSLRGRMLCFQRMGQLDKAYADAVELKKIGDGCSNRIQAETLVARGELGWLAIGDAASYRKDLMKARMLYAKLPGWQIQAPMVQILSNETNAARKHLQDMVENEFEPNLPIFLQLSVIRYFMGDFLKARDYLNQAQTNMVEVGAAVDPAWLIMHALLTYKLQSTIAPDHSSDEYLAIAHRYIQRFGLEKFTIKVTLVQLEHLLMNGHYAAALRIVTDLAKKSMDLPESHHERHLFLCFAMRAAWEMKERPQRGWLLQFQKLKPTPEMSFVLWTHWALAKATEALLPLATTGPTVVKKLKTVGDLLIKLKLKYYYRAILIKETALAKKMGADDAAEKRAKLKEQIDQAIDVDLPD